ncbi:hypothetical protein BKK54_00825 [Rodentibacter genomosp. 1]|uniref:Uncharacterized protein n=1 Tax=Rodentibacter genomosp. 1 TaxID=1908264 RepID=A0A1V3J9H9_9PAST|nr:hypothetical protein [Rodentibacter genomosp. 1]OOF51915.1 hypothetical protein BKK54_00825 [Rodentibacter genomosp. 1]
MNNGLDPNIIEAQFERLKTDEYQSELIEQAENALFADQESGEKAMRTINDFVSDYLENGRHQPIDEWLIGRFNFYPDIWENEQEKIDTANVIISTIDSLVKNQIDVEKALNKGKTLANVLNTKLTDIANQNGFDPTDTLKAIDEGLENANLASTEMYLGQAIPLTPKSESTTPLDIARNITTKAKINANLHLMAYGVRTIGERLYNAVKGKENRSQSEELLHILRSSIETAENKGVQVAMSGGVVVSAKKGWIKAGFDTLNKIENVIEITRQKLDRVTDLVLSVGEGWNDTRILDKVEQGILKTVDVAAEKAKFVVSKVITKVEKTCENWLKTKGRMIGTKIGAVIGSVTKVGPIATVISATIGGYVGEKVGKFVADKVVKPVAKTVKKITYGAIDVVKDTAKTVVSTVSEGVKRVGKFVSSGVSKVKDFFSSLL